MEKIVILMPYFGKLPSYFDAWKVSVLNNDTIDFIVFTDNTQINSEKNLRVVKYTFGEFKQAIQRHLGFDISLESPYKLCDYKPVLGDVFFDFIKGYDYYGYCDCDLVFGDIRHFFNSDKMKECDRFSFRGHLSIFRNTEKMRRLYSVRGEYPEYNFNEAFTTNHSCYFDENLGLKLKTIRERVKIFDLKNYCDPDPSSAYFIDTKKYVGFCKDKKLYKLYEDGSTIELAYFHFQKRIMNVEVFGGEDFFITPGLISNRISLEKSFRQKSGNVFLYRINFKIKKLFKAIRNYGLCGLAARNKRMKKCAKYQRTIKKENASYWIG